MTGATPTAPALAPLLLVKVLPDDHRAVLAPEDIDGAASGVGAQLCGLVAGKDTVDHQQISVAHVERTALAVVVPLRAGAPGACGIAWVGVVLPLTRVRCCNVRPLVLTW